MFKPLTVFSALMLIFGLSNGYCKPLDDGNDAYLVRECIQISERLNDLLNLQTFTQCKSHLNFASTYVDLASKSIFLHQYDEVRIYLIEAIDDLKLSNDRRCINVSEINLLHNELLVIYNGIDD